MKTYLSIPKTIDKTKYIYGFAKLDGSNIRAEFSLKKGFYKFGTRTQLIDINTKPFNKAIELIKSKYEAGLAKVCKENKWESCLFFFEFFGPSSFAGSHNFEEKMDVVLIDANPYKKGLLEPFEFIDLFEHLGIPKVLFEGKLDDELIESIIASDVEGMPFEGVVCKGKYVTPGVPLMFKIKTKAWLDRLKEKCNGDEKLFELLA